MATAIIYGAPGSGKTINTTRIPGKTLLLSSDNSAMVLKNFERPNLTVKEIKNFKQFVDDFEAATESKQYDNIILDNLSDLIDMWLLELDASGKFKDFRQAYQLVYQSLKRLSRESTMLDCNTIFTAWSDNMEITLPNGEIASRLQPKLPTKILDNVCGLMNVVAYINTATDKDGNKRWYYVTEGKPTLIAKDQIGCRKACIPEDLFTIPNVNQ